VRSTRPLFLLKWFVAAFSELAKVAEFGIVDKVFTAAMLLAYLKGGSIMRTFIFCLGFLVTTAASANICTDFSGEYLDSEFSEIVSLTVVQNECQSIELSFMSENESIKYILDGTRVITFKDESFGLTQYSSPKIYREDIVVEIENHWSKDNQVDKFKKRFHLDFHNQKWWLLEQYGDYREDGVFAPRHSRSFLKK
jgi:hypothetical protein